jgi:hypothetical protein
VIGCQRNVAGRRPGAFLGGERKRSQRVWLPLWGRFFDTRGGELGQMVVRALDESDGFQLLRFVHNNMWWVRTDYCCYLWGVGINEI